MGARRERKRRRAEKLISVLEEGRSDDLAWDIDSLAHLEDPAAADALAAHVNHRDLNLRHPAALGLARLGDHRAVDPLVAIVRDDDVSGGSRREAMVGLALVGGIRAVTEFQRQAHADWMGQMTRDDAVGAIVERGDPAELELIERGAAAEPRDPAKEVRVTRELEYTAGRLVAREFEEQLRQVAERLRLDYRVELGDGLLRRRLYVRVTGPAGDIDDLHEHAKALARSSRAWSPFDSPGP